MQKMNQSIDYLKKIRQTINGIENVKELDRMELCRRVVDSMGLPPVAVNPLVSRSLFLNVHT
jgi:DNA-binding XRE family transcriptional regulator